MRWVGVALSILTFGSSALWLAKPAVRPIPAVTEGRAVAATVMAGPFDIHRRYRSMQGPYSIARIRLDELLANPRYYTIPADRVKYTEKEGWTRSGEPLPPPPTGPRRLVWLKGIRLEVLDEQGQVMPGSEFLCHFNLDLDPAFRNRVFTGERCQSTRVFTLTQGQTALAFPEGYALPMASDEVLTVFFQAANQDTDRHRQVTHRLQLDLLPETQRTRPIAALHWFTPYISVVTDGSNDPGDACCAPMSRGAPASNSVPREDFRDRNGHKLSGHWVVPPGKTSWHTPMDERVPEFAARDRRIVLVSAHVHPTCSEFAVVDRPSGETLFRGKVVSRTQGGLGLSRIDPVVSAAGIPVQAGHHYEMRAAYDNPFPDDLDSMVLMCVFCVDSLYRTPDWCSGKAPAPAAAAQAGSANLNCYCGITEPDSLLEQASRNPVRNWGK